MRAPGRPPAHPSSCLEGALVGRRGPLLWQGRQEALVHPLPQPKEPLLRPAAPKSQPAVHRVGLGHVKDVQHVMNAAQDRAGQCTGAPPPWLSAPPPTTPSCACCWRRAGRLAQAGLPPLPPKPRACRQYPEKGTDGQLPPPGYQVHSRHSRRSRLPSPQQAQQALQAQQAVQLCLRCDPPM